MKTPTYKDIEPYIEKGLISMQTHPDAPDFAIFNYTQECQFSRAWDWVTIQCRGLILNLVTGEIIARPFPKFFNYEEHIAKGEQVPGYEPQKFEKYDGSLGILYWLHGKPWIATRGSFTSDQALWATAWLRANVQEDLPLDHTMLFEIIYPANRIVVNYDFSGLVHLATLDTKTGHQIFRPYTPKGIRVVEEHGGPLEALRTGARANAEGYVLYWPIEGLRLKIKHAEYVRLHKLVTGLSKLAIWEHLSEGKPIQELINDVPDEFFNWVNTVSEEMVHEYNGIAFGASTITEEVRLFETRKEQAEYITKNAAHPGVVFAMLDDKEWQKVVWRLVRPRGAQPFKRDIDA